MRTGVASLGQGVETVVAQIAASELDVPAEAIAVHHHDTPTWTSGFGSFASRSTVVAGNAVALAAQELRRRLGEALGVPDEEVVLADGRAYARAARPLRSSWRRSARSGPLREGAPVVLLRRGALARRRRSPRPAA